jgi:hypothetical protein
VRETRRPRDARRMRHIAIVLLVAGCGSDNPAADAGIDAPAVDAPIVLVDAAALLNCETASKAVAQDHTVCTISTVGALVFDMCPSVQWANCGDHDDCPSGWTLSCDLPDPGYNCTYETNATQCGTTASTYPASQYLDGRRGLLVVPSADGNKCEFRPCE